MTINCNGKLIDLNNPKIMGILNCTPDSFFDGGKYKNPSEILSQVEKMLIEGASFIDVGAYSSKPNADFVSEAEEASRLLPILDLLIHHFPDILLSVDTFRASIAEKAVQSGAVIINDISAGSLDTDMFSVVARLQVPYIMMHMRGTPQTMQNLTSYDDICKEMRYYFSEKVAQARQVGINDLLIDPGFGFAKTTEQNFEVLQKLELFQAFDLPLLIGVSRKSMIYKTLNTSSQESLKGTSVLNTIALLNGASILRVHDVKEAMECIQLVQKIA